MPPHKNSPAQVKPESPIAKEEPPAAPKETVPEVTFLAIKVPVVRFKLPNGGRMYSQRRLDAALSNEEADALRNLYDGLIAEGVFKGNPTQSDAVRWLLRQLSMKAVS